MIRLANVLYKVLLISVLLVWSLASRYEERIYRMLSEEPVTPNEIAMKVKVTQKTAQRVLMQLALTKEDVRYKNSGRIHLFWKR